MKKKLFENMSLQERVAARTAANKIMYKRRLIVILSALVLLIICVIFLVNACSNDMNGVKISEPITVTIEQGSGATTIANALKDSGAIKSAGKFVRLAVRGGYDKKFQPGPITVEPNMTYEEIMQALSKPNRDTVKIVIPEGYELRQIVDTIVDTGIVSREDLTAALDPTQYDYDFLKNLPKRENALEGYLFPDTYRFSPNISAHDMIDTMLGEFNNIFTAEYKQRAKELNMSVDKIVTLASIIERETNSSEERAKVAGVFYNRIKKNMKLQSCATVQYILKERKTNLSAADTRIDSPYNTYKYSGLPVGPIASPGKDCIAAALYPEETDALFFVMGKDGKHIFSKTYSDHLKAKQEAGL